MAQTVTPVNITAAALITQFSLIAIVFVAVVILRTGERGRSVFHDEPSSSHLFLITLGFALLTIGTLVLADEFSNIWKPLFQDLSFGGIGWSMALLLVFLADIVWVTVLVSQTGGSSSSVFVSLFSIIPALAIFLREPLGRIALYVALTTVGFSFGMVASTDEGVRRGGTRRPLAFWFVAVSSFVLTTFIGYVTRPR